MKTNRTFKNKYRGFTIVITEVNPDRVDYKILNPDGTLMDGTDCYCVTVDEAMDTCKEIINEENDNQNK